MARSRVVVIETCLELTSTACRCLIDNVGVHCLIRNCRYAVSLLWRGGGGGVANRRLYSFSFLVCEVAKCPLHVTDHGTYVLSLSISLSLNLSLNLSLSLCGFV